MRRLPVSAPVGALLDVVALVVFAAIGRRSHAEASSLLGAVATAWPFLAGAALGWAVCLLHRRRPPLDVRSGLLVWVSAVVVGMGLRGLTGQGTALSFVVVASIATAVFLLGWRAIAGVVARRQRA